MSRVAKLFKDAPDLMNGLRSFLGDSGFVPVEEPVVTDTKGKKKQESSSSAAPPKRKRKVADKDKNGKSSKVCFATEVYYKRSD